MRPSSYTAAPLAVASASTTRRAQATRANANLYGLAGYLFNDSAKSILAVSER